MKFDFLSAGIGGKVLVMSKTATQYGYSAAQDSPRHPLQVCYVPAFLSHTKESVRRLNE